MKKNPGKQRQKKVSPSKETSFICFNKDCRLRKQKSCKGFEGCPGFKGR